MGRRNSNRPTEDQIVDFKIRLTAAFEDLRRRGYLARQNFQCCGGCAGYAMAVRAEELHEKGKRVMGTVFYHNQDNANLRDGEDFYLAYGELNTTKYGTLGRPNEEVGAEVVEVLRQNGISTEWDGNGATRILVKILPGSTGRTTGRNGRGGMGRDEVKTW